MGVSRFLGSLVLRPKMLRLFRFPLGSPRAKPLELLFTQRGPRITARVLCTIFFRNILQTSSEKQQSGKREMGEPPAQALMAHKGHHSRKSERPLLPDQMMNERKLLQSSFANKGNRRIETTAL